MTVTADAATVMPFNKKTELPPNDNSVDSKQIIKLKQSRGKGDGCDEFI